MTDGMSIELSADKCDELMGEFEEGSVERWQASVGEACSGKVVGWVVLAYDEMSDEVKKAMRGDD